VSAHRWATLAAVLPLVLGCSASGLDAKSTFGCKAPDGVTCMSVTGVYATSRANALPGQQPAAPGTSTKEAPPPAPSQVAARDAAAVPSSLHGSALPEGAPLRSAPRVLRIWIAPYEDSDGDLRDQSHMYVTVDPGTWQIEHARRAIRERFAPVRTVTPVLPSASSDSARPVDATVPPAARQDRSELFLPSSGARLGGQ
jgi:conjugal transfer pilus assembly protein TraV